MEVLTVTLKGDNGKCHKCRMTLKAGDRCVISKDGDDSVEFTHFKCPEAPKTDVSKRVIQGSK